MAFDPHAYGPEVARALALDGDGARLLELANPRCTLEGAREAVRGLQVPQAALAGLYLYFGYWDEAHETAQAVETREGSYWHAIVHRQEPDAGNAGYWFRQVGAHPIFPALRARAAEIGFDAGSVWNPAAFVEYCERARRDPGSEMERRAREVQRAEWQLLFDYSMRDSSR
jgi:hypothetical protein